MEKFYLAYRNIVRKPFMSGVVFTCVMLVAGSGIWATFIAQGALEKLRLGIASMASLEADIVVVPRGTGYSGVGIENVDLEGLLGNIRIIPGVSMASPQLRLLTIVDSQYCKGSDLYLVAFDPASDFTVLSRLPEQRGGEIGLGEAVIGSNISVPSGEKSILLAGYEVKPLGYLSATGTSLDQSILITFATAREIMQQAQNKSSAIINKSSIPTILVKINPEIDPHTVIAKLLKDIPGISIVDNTDYFRSGYDQLSGMIRKIPVLLGMLWFLSALFIGMVFTIAFNERRREIGILRSLGFTHVFVLRYLLTEGFILALGGGLTGIILSIILKIFFREAIVQATALPLVPSSPLMLIVMAIGSLALASCSVIPAVLFPAWKINREEPAIVLRG